MTRSRDDIVRELEAAGSSLAGVERTCGELKAKIASLQMELAALPPMANSAPGLPLDTWAPQTPADKVKLFRSLFRGRTDVFPVRFVSKKTGRAGYAPACSNKWLPELCLLKSGGKCSDCTNQSFIPVGEQLIVEHLQGRHVMGVYPLLEDETCWFLAVDFDKRSWQEDVTAFAETCRSARFPVAIERSRSGNGAHAWFFFTAPVSANIARRMGCYLITETVGLTATPQRRDGHQAITDMQLGPVRYRVDAKSQAARRPFEHKLIVRETGLRVPAERTSSGIQDVYRVLAEDKERNQRIIDDIIAALQEGRSPILLTERKDHLDHLANKLGRLVRHLIVLKGGTSGKERRHALEQLASIPDASERLVLATGRYVGEGFDDARLDTLFLAMPVSWKGTLIQYAGRLHRHHPRKVEVRIYDYVDREVPMLLRMFEKRLTTYRAIGYARGKAPLGFGEPPAAELTIEYDEEALRHFDSAV